MSSLLTITQNTKIGSVRHEQMDGKDYVVVPIAMIGPGVYAGSNGPLRYTENELKKHVAVWNMKPLVVYHPQINGKGITATDPVIVENRAVGLVMNTKFERGKLRCEGWFDLDKTKKVDYRVYEAINNSALMEVSTGLFSDMDWTAGEEDGKPYDGTVHNIKPDHLAILPDKEGAYSIADGGGLFQLNTAMDSDLAKGVQEYLTGIRTQKGVLELLKNARSVHSLMDTVLQKIREKYGEDNVWLVDLFDDNTAIFEKEDTTYRVSFAKNDDEVVLLDGLTEVIRVVEYKPVSDSTTNNEETNNGEHVMKDKLVNGLISSDRTKLTEENREWLMSLNESELELLVPQEETQEEGTDGDEPESVLKPEVSSQEPATANSSTPLSLDDYINNAPPEIQEVLVRGQQEIIQKKQGLIKTITANQNNKFTEQWLNGRTLEELEGMASLANTAAKKTPTVRASYFGQAGVPAVVNEKNEAEDKSEEGLSMPVINWSEVSSAPR